jgi:patatin-related protein
MSTIVEANVLEKPHPTATGPDEQPRKSCEVRLGLVLYGGVSLAIYINGAVREFFEAVRGRGVYKLLKVLTDSDITVDVVSGTSAGGINGILLAYALCNGREFADSAALWRRDGGIRQLLRDPGGSANNWDSLLDSEGYYQPAVEAAFRYMGAYAPETSEEPSPIDELDVYITGTDVDGTVWTQFDDAGHAIEVKEHRGVFLLKHRAGRPALDPNRPGVKQPFNPRPPGVRSDLAAAYEATTYAALGKLARITSCFPAAFAPVHVRQDRDVILSADARLQEWGRLGKESCFLDGGVLDNKPFSYTLQAIFSRNADRRVTRKLFYVEPDPEVFQRRLEASRPNVLQAAMAALIGIPGYESISSDLKAIAEHNSRVQQYWRVVEKCTASIQNAAGTAGSDPTARALYMRSRKVALSDRVIRGVLRKDGRSTLMTEPERRAAADLVRSFDDGIQDPVPLFVRFDVLYRLRRAYHVAYFVYDHLYPSAPAPEPDADHARRYLEVLRAFNRQIEILEIIRAAMELLVDEYPFQWEDAPAEGIWAQVQAIYDNLLALPFTSLFGAPGAAPPSLVDGRPGQIERGTLAVFHQEIFERAAGIIRPAAARAAASSGTPQSPSAEHNLLSDTDLYEAGIIATLDRDDPVAVAYRNFERIDEHVFPIELLSGLEQKDVIETIRISPRDAEKGFSRRGFSDKVAGDALYHFGGFFKRSWRSNDILWGRLDGTCQLIEKLLDPARIRQVVNSEDLRVRVRTQLAGPALRPEHLFPRAGQQTHDKLAGWLDRLVSDSGPIREAALDPREFGQMLELLIEATQLELIHNDLPNVITDALEEQAEWSEVPVDERREPTPSPSVAPAPAPRAAGNGTGAEGDRTDGAVATGNGNSPGAWVFQPLERRIDPFVAMVAAAERMRSAIREVVPSGEEASRPRETVLGRFFRQSYRVGAESLTRDIPPRVLLEILAVTLLVVSKCVLAAFGAQGESIRKSLLYRLIVGLPLWALYRLTVALRTTSRRRLLIMAGVAILGILLAAWSVAQIVGYAWPYAIDHPVPLLIFSLILLGTDYGVYRLLRQPRGYAPALQHTATVSDPAGSIDAYVATECTLRDAWLDVRLMDGSLRASDPHRPELHVRRIRVGLAGHEDRTRLSATCTADSRPPSAWRREAMGPWKRVSWRVSATAPIALARQKHRVPLRHGLDRTCMWLVVELQARPRWWWPFGSHTIVVHSRRYFEDPAERPGPAK